MVEGPERGNEGRGGEGQGDEGPVDAPPPISPSTSLVSLGLAVGGACLVALAIAGALYAAVSHAIKDDSAAPSTTLTPTSLPPVVFGTTTTAVPQVERPLSDLVIAAPPEGYAPVLGPGAPNGNFDLEGFLEFAENPRADRIAFEENGFVRGFARSWRRPSSLGESRIIASVFEFSTASGARAIEEYQSGRTVRDDDGTPFAVPGASALRFTHRAGRTTVHGYAITIRRAGENRLYYLTALYPTELPPTEIVSVVEEQQRRIQAEG
jgi:hypothetical protein